MGVGPSVEGPFTVWRRIRTTDRYEPTPLWTWTLPSIGEALGGFKREVYALALGRDHGTCKSVYLYRGRWRLAKALVYPATTTQRRVVVVSWYSRLIRDTYLTVEERLANGTRWPLCGTAFARTFAREGDPATALVADALEYRYMVRDGATL